jgi:hypothetical protein
MIEKFEKEIEQCLFNDLADHINKEAVFEVGLNFNLAKMANALASDDVSTVSNAIENKDLIKVVLSDIEKNNGKFVNCIIISPFVLIQAKK